MCKDCSKYWHNFQLKCFMWGLNEHSSRHSSAPIKPSHRAMMVCRNTTRLKGIISCSGTIWEYDVITTTIYIIWVGFSAIGEQRMASFFIIRNHKPPSRYITFIYWGIWYQTVIFLATGKNMLQSTGYPKKYAHDFCFAVLCCGYTLTDFPISIRLTSLALWQSNDCPSASKATLMNIDKYFMWIHYEGLHNHNKAKHNKTVCIQLWHAYLCATLDWELLQCIWYHMAAVVEECDITQIPTTSRCPHMDYEMDISAQHKAGDQIISGTRLAMEFPPLINLVLHTMLLRFGTRFAVCNKETQLLYLRQPSVLLMHKSVWTPYFRFSYVRCWSKITAVVDYLTLLALSLLLFCIKSTFIC